MAAHDFCLVCLANVNMNEHEALPVIAAGMVAFAKLLESKFIVTSCCQTLEAKTIWRWLQHYEIIDASQLQLDLAMGRQAATSFFLQPASTTFDSKL